MNLFDYTQRGIDEQANAYAKMSDQESSRAMLYKAGAGIAGGIKGMLGIEDPEMKKASEIKLMTQGLDLTTAKGLKELAIKLGEKGYNQEGAMAAKRAREIEKSELEQKKTIAETSKLEAQATAAERGWGRINTQMYTPESLAKFKESQDFNDLVLVTKPTQAQSPAGKLAQDRGKIPGTPEFAAEVARIEQEQKQLKDQKSNQLKAMPASIRKEVDTLQEHVDTFNNNIEDIGNILKMMDENKVKFSPNDNLESFLKTVFNNSDEASRIKSDLRASIEGMRNAILQGNKGTQTEGDAKRAADEILSAIDKNDTETVYRRLRVLQTKFGRAMEQRKQRLDNYYSAYGEKTPTKQEVSTPPTAPPKFSVKTKEEVKAAYKAGKISKQDAIIILKDMDNAR